MPHRSRFRIAALALPAFLAAAVCHAVGQWNGQDLLHVPISWCVVEGSPAHSNPNVAGDTTTDAIIWRRHERPTDGIYVNATGISFRSAINDAWGMLDFPIIADPNTMLGVPGDMRGEDVSDFGDEFNQMLADCEAAWAALGRGGIGITAVNAGMFHDGNGSYVTTIGWGGCVQDAMNPGPCVSPLDGVVTVIDNHYLHPSVPDRTWPDGSDQFLFTDPLDQLVGHELGHALSLPHRTDRSALMNPSQRDTNGDNLVDNIALTNAEVTMLRNTALTANGLEIDPPNLFVPGSVVAMTQPDRKRDPRLPAHLDLSSVKAAFDANTKTFSLGQRLFGLLPKGAAQRHWFLVDSDGPLRGASATVLRSLGVPETDFTGADLVVRADVAAGQVSGGAAWRINNGDPTSITASVKFRLLVLDLHPHFAQSRKQKPSLAEKPSYPVYHIIDVSLSGDLAGIGAGQTVNAHAIVANSNSEAVDRLDQQQAGRGNPFELTPPSFPHCYPQAAGAPGGTVKVDFEGLKPNLGYHALLGARLVARGTTDSQGNGTVELAIPKDTTPGLHLVTIGNDRTALTADCTVTVGGTQK